MSGKTRMKYKLIYYFDPRFIIWDIGIQLFQHFHLSLDLAKMFLVNAQPVSCLLARPHAYKAITLYDAADVI